MAIPTLTTSQQKVTMTKDGDIQYRLSIFMAMMTKQTTHRKFGCLATILLMWVVSMVSYAEKTFFLLNKEQGLTGKNVYQIAQLGDGRIAVDTESDICLYDGAQFTSVSKGKHTYYPLLGYQEYTRMYVDKHHRLWIKDTKKAACLDLKRLEWVNWRQGDDMQHLDNLLVDTQGNLWTVKGNKVYFYGNKLILTLTGSDGNIQDIDYDRQWVYVFTNLGIVIIYNAINGKRVTTIPAYPKEEQPALKDFSLVTRRGHCFYQLRMGWGHAICQMFDTKTKQWKRLLDCDYALHTLVVSHEDKIYVSSAKGYWTIDLKTGVKRLRSTLRLPDGNRLKTGFNTICQDREGGLWLGSYDKGIFYSSPLSNIFDTHERKTILTPVLLSVYLKGSQLHRGVKGMEQDAPFLQKLTMNHADNSLAFSFSAMKFVRPQSIFYRYRIVELDDHWNIVNGMGSSHVVDENGRFTKLAKNEQRTLMSLWGICHSPLFFGGEMTKNTAFTARHSSQADTYTQCKLAAYRIQEADGCWHQESNYPADNWKPQQRYLYAGRHEGNRH